MTHVSELCQNWIEKINRTREISTSAMRKEMFYP